MLPCLRLVRPVRFGLPRLRGTTPGLLCCCCSLLLNSLLAPEAAAQMGLKPRLYTTGSSLRRAFAEVTAQARLSTVEIEEDDETIALGVVVGADGWILTKASELGPKVVVKVADNDRYVAKVVGTHDATDLALLKINATDLTPIEWEPATNPAVGQWIVSPSMRETPEAIGVVGSPRRKIARERTPGVLGVALEGDDGPPRIMTVTEKSGASAAGLQVGDVIEKIDGISIDGKFSMIKQVREHNPGDALKLSIRRGEEALDVDVTLTPPPSDEFLSRIAIQNRMGGDLSERRTGFEAIIQHDSVLWPEDCGGPAVGLSGKAIGINIARAGRTETYTLPADLIVPVIDELKLQAPASVVSKEKE
jgi:serine protease Do